VQRAPSRHGRAAVAPEEALDPFGHGGETSGAVVTALGLGAFDIGPEIAPGVPALSTPGGAFAIALKSGNFGGTDFFAKALAVLENGR